MMNNREKILRYLEKNAKYTAKNIADALNIKEAEVQYIIDQCQEEGTILGYKTLIDWDKTDDGLVTAIIEIRVLTKKDDGFKAVARQICAFPEVKSLYLMSGGYDFAVIIEGKSMKEVSYFVFEKLAVIDGVTSTATHFILNKYKDNDVIFGQKEEDDRQLFDI